MGEKKEKLDQQRAEEKDSISKSGVGKAIADAMDADYVETED